MNLTVWGVDPKQVQRGMLSPLTVKAVIRNNDVSTYVVTLDGEEPLASRLAEGWSLVIDDGTTRLSGRITGIRTEIQAGALALEVSGEDELHRLKDRITYPNPAQPAASQDKSHYTESGAAETVLKNLVNLSCGPGARTERRSLGLSIEPDAGHGGQVKISERFTNVLEVAQKVASTGGVCFSAVREDTGTVMFRTRLPVDFSRKYRFQATGEVKLTAPTANAVILAGQGEGADRFISENTRTDDWGHRVEILKDRRDTDDDKTLDTAAKEALDAGAASSSASFKVQERADLLFGKDYRVGDTVSFQLGQATVSEQIQSAEISWDGFGREITLNIGAESASSTPVWAPKLRELDSRLRGIEARN